MHTQNSQYSPPTTPSIFSFIGDGCRNKIGGSIAAALGAEYGFIGSGQNNCIDTGAVMSTATPFGVIGGGQNNTICAGTCYSAIVGGQDNCVTHNWATVAGCGVTSVMDCAFHTNNVVAQNIPFGNPVTCAPPVSLPIGALYYVVVPPGGFCQVWIV